MKIIYEPDIAEHAPALYLPDETASGDDFIDGFGAFGKTAARRFSERGFLVVRGALGDAEVAAARDELRAMTLADDPGCGSVAFEGSLQRRLALAISSEADTGSGQFSLGATKKSMPELPRGERAKFVRKFMDFTKNHPPLHRAAHKPELLDAIGKLLADTPRLFQEMALLKPPGGREKPWHQDHAYFNFELDTKIVGVWIALGDVNPENGCMFVLAGGHANGPRPHFLRRDWQVCDTEIAPLAKTAVPMKAGDLLFFDGKLPHGTPINRTETTRWALQFHYLGERAVATDDAARLAIFGAEGKNVAC